MESINDQGNISPAGAQPSPTSGWSILLWIFSVIAMALCIITVGMAANSTGSSSDSQLIIGVELLLAAIFLGAFGGAIQKLTLIEWHLRSK